MNDPLRTNARPIDGHPQVANLAEAANSLASAAQTSTMQDLATAREAYLRSGEPESTVRPIVRESWKRCRAYGIHPRKLDRQTPDAARLARAREQHASLIAASSALIEGMHETLGQSPHLIALAAPDGTILRILASTVASDIETDANLFEGASWHERAIGCNGVGTALELRSPVILVGAEHFQEAYVGWTCIGVPIVAANGSIVGALDLSVPNEHVHIHTWGWTLQIACAIGSAYANRTATDRHTVAGLANPFNAIEGVLDLVVREVDLSQSHRHFVDEARVEVEKAKLQGMALRRLVNTVTMAEDLERKRIAGVLHDDLQQVLMAGRMQLASGSFSTDRILELLDAGIDVCRSLARALNPPLSSGLAAAIEWLVGRFQENYGFTVEATLNDIPRLAEDETLFLFNALQELLLNAVKHSGASAAAASVVRSSAGTVTLEVNDRGVGMDWDGIESLGSFGLLTLRERAVAFGGEVVCESSPGRGTCIRVTLPITSEGH
jgi:signal transduction histidine kinase